MLWRYLWFRWAAYGVTRAAGKARSWLCSGWRPHALALTTVGGAGVSILLIKHTIHDKSNQVPTDFLDDLLTWTFVVEVVVIYTLLWLVCQAYLNRDRLVILATINNAGEDFNKFAQGLPAYLVNHLGRLSKLYKTIDEANRPTPDPVVLKVRVEDKGEQLANVIGERSQINLGPLNVPLKPLTAAIERLTGGQRLSTSLDRRGNSLTLLANMPGVERTWRVDGDLAGAVSEDDMAARLSEMREELLYRVFGELVPTGSKEWKAVKEFSEGLSAFRLTLFTDMDRKLNLRDAEQHFFAARSFDKYFARCSYNLGVVYRQRGHEERAKSAFKEAIKDNPTHVDAAYALSVIYQQEWELKQREAETQAARPKLEQALEFADRTITHQPGHAQAWNMKASLLRLMHANPDSKAAWRSSLKFHEKAAAFAWRDLCHTAWRGQNLDAARKEIVKPFKNLAVAHLNLAEHGRAEKILRQAIRQQKAATLYFTCGQVLRSRGENSRDRLLSALGHYRNAVHFAPTLADRVRYWAFIAETHARIATLGGLKRENRDRDEALQAWKEAFAEAFASPSSIDEDTRSTLSEACLMLQETDKCKVIECVRKVLEVLELKQGETNPERLKRVRQAAKNSVTSQPKASEIKKIDTWARAVFAIDIGNLLMQNQQEQQSKRTFRRSEGLLRYSVSRLKKHFPAEMLLGPAYEGLAEALRRQSKFDKALANAEHAVTLNLFSASAIRQLGSVHFDLANYDRAEQELLRSFALDPSDAKTLEFIGLIYWKRADLSMTREGRRSELRKVIETFNQAVDLAKNDDDRGWLHHWLGRFHGDLSEYESARKHYDMAKALKIVPVENLWYLAWIAIEQGLFERAEEHLHDALREIFQWRRTAKERAQERAKEKVFLAHWLRTPQKTSYPTELAPPGYFLLQVCCFMALVFAESSRDIARARRCLGFVERHLDFLGPLPLVGEREERQRHQRQRRDIIARFEDYLGWTDFRDDMPGKAREHIEKSVKVFATATNLYHLARVYLAQGSIAQARECCDRARTVDIRGAFEARIKKIEADAKARTVSH